MELRWAFLPALIVLTAMHYVFAAIALRAAAGTRLPLRDTVMTQLTAAAANRVTPGGPGGSAVNVRFLTCHGAGSTEAVLVAALGARFRAASRRRLYRSLSGSLKDLPLTWRLCPYSCD